MPVNVETRINENRLYTFVKKMKDKILLAQKEAMEEAGSVVSDYIKNDLLAGGILNDTTGFPRSKHNTSLPQGALRKSIQVRTFSSETNTHMTVSVAGSDDVKLIAKRLIEGRTGGWDIPSELPNPSGKMLKFWMNLGGEFDVAYSTSVHHPGYEARDFITAALKAKEDYVKRLTKHFISKATKS